MSRRVRIGFVCLLAALLSAPLGWSAGSPEGREPTVRESGSTVTEEFDYSGFEALQISSAFLVDLAQADRYRVRVTVDESFLPALEVRKTGSTLHIGFRPGFRSVGVK